MANLHGSSASHKNHIEALRARHAMLSQKIEHEQRSPSSNGNMLRRLKAEKLKLKDQIESGDIATG